MKQIAGFTLIEILVVLFIVSIMSGIVVANLPRMTRTGDLDTEARRLDALLSMARQDAILEASEYGFMPDRNEYQFYVYDDMAQQWKLLTESPFETRHLPSELALTATVEKSPLKLAGKDKSKTPPILLLSSGETTPFNLTLSMPSADRSKTLVANGYGKLEWQNDAADK